MAGNDTLLELRGVSKSYRVVDSSPLLVLDHMDLHVHEGEIIALLGQSGSGKSTALRIMAGLTSATDGEVRFAGRPVQGPVRGIAMVFQSFALFPWLTVLENVELGLQAQGVSAAERRERAIRAIDLIGLDGFESAYPRELSGGMRQRVGFARALVVQPSVLLLDEPFSALDVLTAETLRGDLVELWEEHAMPMKAIVLVSHNIQEAVEMADRIIVMEKDPGHVRADLPVALPKPRDPHTPAFQLFVDEVYTLLTTPKDRPVGRRAGLRAEAGIGYRLPSAPIQQMAGLLDAVDSPPYNGRADLPELARQLHLTGDDLLRLAEALELLQLAHVTAGDIVLSESGRAFLEADMQERKMLFARHLMHHVPLATHIRRVLDERASHSAPAQRFLTELEDYLSDDEAERVLMTVVAWSRYAELFAYDANSEVLSLENP
ncbi:MAG TPA: nitrate/sulfonate/bicarbonate ABC transporter ATP-binding protein [bacterium]|nr:nitrate/sulfonate/bicarbonate ABC transporter ATP-binding protein [bacterium]